MSMLDKVIIKPKYNVDEAVDRATDNIFRVAEFYHEGSEDKLRLSEDPDWKPDHWTEIISDEDIDECGNRKIPDPATRFSTGFLSRQVLEEFRVIEKLELPFLKSLNLAMQYLEGIRSMSCIEDDTRKLMIFVSQQYHDEKPNPQAR
ncbi:hypothetical protein ACIU1J_30075 [Azospirillum doebereinerae]|uniref:hypothetical protein n=1 Tax=Azospirillum doebereinerae TaxID=92933 RepID=UPI001EE510F4|nr:hypothetical protein [Azospirillum doebereinerae]MCG5240938.1 hypothetical protein [Azospirillum doebereinerae]